MDALLPYLFIALAGGSLLFVLYALWRSFRGLAAGGDTATAAGAASARRVQLLMEKKQLLAALKDLEFERDVGKLSPDDHAALNARYRARAREVLRALDGQIAGYRDEAKALIAAHLKEE